MLLTARVLKRLGATQALSIDSGRSATIWTAFGRGNGCPRLIRRGRCFGLTGAMGLDWQPPVPNVAVLSLR
jgi:hypothetical protein